MDVQKVNTHRRGTPRRTTQRRKLVWAETGGTLTPGVAGAGAITDLLAGYRAGGGSTQGITIMRTHIAYSAFLHAAPNAGNGFASGVIVDDTAQTVATMNTSQIYKDWMYITNKYSGNSDTAFASGTGFIYGGDIDLRSKRKCQELQQTLWMCTDRLTANVIDVAFLARVLIALP